MNRPRIDDVLVLGAGYTGAAVIARARADGLGARVVVRRVERSPHSSIGERLAGGRSASKHGTWEPSMTTISFELPDDAVVSMHMPPSEVPGELRMAAAVKLYELGRLSSGAAARLAGVPRVAFLARLAEYGVDTFRLTEEELLADVQNA